MLVSILLFGLGAKKVHFRSELFTGIRFWQATVRLTIFTWMYSGVLGKVPVTGETGLWEVLGRITSHTGTLRAFAKVSLNE